jgi:hypothetical protein
MSKRILVVEDQAVIVRSSAICWRLPIMRSPRLKTVNKP